MGEMNEADELKAAQARKLLLTIARYELEALKRLYQDLGTRREGEGDLVDVFKAIDDISIPGYPELDREVNEDNYLEVKLELIAPGSMRRYQRRRP
jgi:hypothetical protein